MVLHFPQSATTHLLQMSSGLSSHLLPDCSVYWCVSIVQASRSLVRFMFFTSLTLVCRPVRKIAHHLSFSDSLPVHSPPLTDSKTCPVPPGLARQLTCQASSTTASQPSTSGFPISLLAIFSDFCSEICKSLLNGVLH